jgi:arsenate reductase
MEMKRQEILFVCIGNACRSQMAEGFARHYGGDVVACSSAGMMPLLSVPALTRRVMLEKNIPIDDQYPKGIELFRHRSFDRIINMSGMAMPSGILGKVEEWVVADPYGRSDGIYRQVRDHLEGRVMKLLMELRNRPAARPLARPARLKLRGV